MSLGRGRKIVLLGMMSKHPVAGVIWQTVHYLVGFRRLGFDVYYVEAGAFQPSWLLVGRGEDGDRSAKAAAFIDGIMQRFDLGDRWAFHALHADGRCYGLSEVQLKQLYRSAALLINLHGATVPLPEHTATGRLVYLETDPVTPQIELYDDLQQTIDFLEQHCAFFTFGENYGNPGCKVPVSEHFDFRPTRQPVVLDFWQPHSDGAGSTFTTIGNWQNPGRDVTFQGEVYHWSKHHEFMKFLDLPDRTNQALELALSRCHEADKCMLESKGWQVRDALGFSTDLDAYRSYIARSRGEFTVAKDQNIRLRSGWFSDRSATYLAAGRPVVTQETGFSNILPIGQGLFAFSEMEEAEQAFESINSDYEHHCQAARALAREYFNYDVVLPQLLAYFGLPRFASSPRGRTIPEVEARPFPPGLVLAPTSRWPTTLPEETVRAVLTAPLTVRAGPLPRTSRRVTIVVVTLDNLVYTRLCLESVLAYTEAPDYEIVVVDNGSLDDTPAYLRSLAEANTHVRVILNDRNCGFAAATNQGLAAATGETLVLLNNDTIVLPGWLARLVRHLDDPAVGLIGPLSNRTGNEAEIEAPYRTYGELLAFAWRHAEGTAGERADVRTLAMFCAAMRRDVYERIGLLDERFGLGMFEDDDYAMRVRAAGYRVSCAEDVFVHHFGQASIGKLAADSKYGALFHANRRRFEKKWGVRWEPHRRRPNHRYQQLAERIREVVRAALPRGANVIVVSKGDDALLDLDDRRAWHFPQTEDGEYAGHHPADCTEAITQLEALRVKGGDYLLFPETALWWLEHYVDFRRHLERWYCEAVRREDTCVIFALRGGESYNGGADTNT
ncbi:MAG: hypothetical protein AVDCRST_MAG93-4242, partial [uncultured Chloroflexia bacterium]